MEQKKDIRRGEMWYISAPNHNPASTPLGRPAIVLSNDKACAAAPEIAAVYTTTNLAKSVFRENVHLFSPERECTARCNGVPLIPRGWFQYKMCNISDEELKAIEKGLFFALDISVDEELHGLKRQLSFYKALYRETLNELARKQLAEDVAAEVAAMRDPAVELPEPSEEEAELAELERQLMELEQLGPMEPVEPELTEIEPELTEAEPEFTEDELPAPKKVVNVNTASWWQMHRHFEIDQDTAREIVGEKIKRGGRFQTVEEVMELRCLSKKDVKKMAGRVSVE